MSDVKKITIAGAGPVGSLAAIYLARRGYTVRVLESRHDPRSTAIAQGRSINLALSNRGRLPLREVGLEQLALQAAISMPGRMMHDPAGTLTFQPYGQNGQAIYSISRTGLNTLLIDEAEALGVHFHFGRKCSGIDFDKNVVYVEQNGHKKACSSDLIIGTDGAFSMIRQHMQRTDRFDYSQYYIRHGYKELSIAPAATGTHAIEKHALHIWPRGNFMLIALPNTDGSFTGTLFLPFSGRPSFDSLRSDKEVLEFFQSVFPDACALMPSLPADYRRNLTASLVTVRCYPWVKNKTLIMGDASHAIVPFYGQGMNSGLEDCRILNDLLNRYDDSWEEVLPRFQAWRKPDADAISDLALQNFTEMRDLVADADFLLRKKIEARLHELFPDKWVPLYSMVTFSEQIRYSDALKTGQVQKAIMDEVMADKDIRKNWESLNFEHIAQRLVRSSE